MLVLQSPSRPTAMLTALESLALPTTDELRFAVAYATLPGCKTLLPRLIGRIGERRWRSIPKTAIVTTDFHLTEPRALRYLRSAGFDVRLSDVRPVNYHPKLYAFMSSRRVEALVGSANLTLSALSDNVEVGACSHLTDRAGFLASWIELLNRSQELTPSLLRRYTEQRRRQPPKLRPDRTSPAGASAPIGRLPAFTELVESGVLRPAGFEALWVEVGTPSGGSRNQAELPRGAYRFFGFTGGGGPGQHLIGTPALISGGHEWPDRKLTWHGQGAMNQMERLNLPTLAQGGFQYVGSTVLFTRRGSRFQLTVAPAHSAIARAWRRASREAGHEYRLGKRNSKRRCGLF